MGRCRHAGQTAFETSCSAISPDLACVCTQSLTSLPSGPCFSSHWPSSTPGKTCFRKWHCSAAGEASSGQSWTKDECVVAGAGCARCNGSYAHVGTYKEDALYQCGATGLQIWRNGGEWRLGTTQNYYYVSAGEWVEDPVWRPAAGELANAETAADPPSVTLAASRVDFAAALEASRARESETNAASADATTVLGPDEFIALIRKRCERPLRSFADQFSDAQLKHLFETYDDDGNNEMDADELVVAWKKATDKKISTAEAQALISQGATNGNATLDKEEFVQVVRAHG